MPMSMLSVTTRTLLSMSHARMVVINASSSFLIDVPRSTLLDLRTKHLSMLHRKVAITNVSGFFLTVVLTGCISMYVRESERLSCYIASTCECTNSFIPSIDAGIRTIAILQIELLRFDSRPK